MIIVCEPGCKGFCHESVNSGFLYGLRLAHPDETIRLYAEINNINAIKNIFTHNNILIENIEYYPIEFQDTFWGMFLYYKLFKEMFNTALNNDVNKIFFLSILPNILWSIKLIKQEDKFSHMKFVLVLHGEFEAISGDKPQGIDLPTTSLPSPYCFKTISRMSYSDIYHKGIWVVNSLLNKPWRYFSSKVFVEKKILQWNNSNDYNYICISPHILEKAKQYINTDEIKIHTIVYPIIFAPSQKYQHKNKFVKFAVFGYGNFIVMHNILMLLSKQKINRKYEIKIIGMDARGTDGFSNITCPSLGKKLTRQDMEHYAEDVDIFMILYDKSRYRLSCTGSIMESLSYIKPVLHFDNDCINTFNTPELPIGFKCNTLEDFVFKMVSIINNYETYQETLNQFKNNIMILREKYDVKNNANGSLITLIELMRKEA